MEQDGRRRLIAVIAATVISIACGTNYGYSAWSPQFSEKLRLTATESNLIGAAGNIGMYATGIPLGYLCDTRGPRLNMVIGAFASGGGYYPLLRAYQDGAGSMSVALLCVFSFITGLGSSSAFGGAIKVAALNWPHHGGTATAFPLAAFGLSAFFFTSVSGLLFPDSTSKYLLLLALGTFSLIFFPVFFISVPNGEVYHALATSDDADRTRRDSNVMRRSSEWRPEVTDPAPSPEIGTPPETVTMSQGDIENEGSSLLSADSAPGDIGQEEAGPRQSSKHGHSHQLQITGVQLLRNTDFWILIILLGVLSGCGLMTINNIGNDSNALWRAYDPDTSRDFIVRRQLMHVSIISCGSFVGRLLSGIGSDFLVKRHHLSRFWCLVASSGIFAVAQFAALGITDPYHLWIVSSVSGFGYGVLFGVYPALVTDAFGVHGLALNWGFMTLAPAVFGNIFNIWYGMVFDANSTKSPAGELICDKGLACYKNAYWLSAASSIVGILVSLGTVYRDGKRMQAERESSRRDD